MSLFDIKNRMQNFTEMNFYDGTLNLNISLRLKLKAHNSPAADGNRLGQILSPFSRKEPIDAQISK